ncbi:flagellar assembly protein FliH [Nitrococcus mobilis]|uniref:Flagellar assembly protein FliH n=1 Tax=Nitrococcus mobilis Nb-231 TaxID=314278 RepID=A4BUD8_9GAMM|nr:flagellar assembly protein FliH [Nitrococcus mobilis]EAR20652.1 Flagellar assembly protein FliH [Nitrococcus mobilis Nb-231]
MTDAIISRAAREGGQANTWHLPDVSESTAASTQEVRQSNTSSGASGVSVEVLERIQREAYAEAFEEGRREGHAAGFREGHEAGFAQGQAEASELVRRMGELLDGLAQPATELDDAAEQELVHLVLCLAQQIIRRELQIQPGEIVSVIREAIALLPLSARKVKVQVHPDDAIFIRETLGEGEMVWQLVDDPSITRGGCLVNTARSRVDATLEHRLTALAAEWLGDGRRRELGAEAYDSPR